MTPKNIIWVGGDSVDSHLFQKIYVARTHGLALEAMKAKKKLYAGKTLNGTVKSWDPAAHI